VSLPSTRPPYQKGSVPSSGPLDYLYSLVDLHAQALGMTHGWFTMLSAILVLELMLVFLLVRVLRRRRFHFDGEAERIEQGGKVDKGKEQA
jgi:hypothetical protein